MMLNIAHNCLAPERLRDVIVGETVRREKALDFSGCNSRPGTLRSFCFGAELSWATLR
jgi:hypothetical protein